MQWQCSEYEVGMQVPVRSLGSQSRLWNKLDEYRILIIVVLITVRSNNGDNLNLCHNDKTNNDNDDNNSNSKTSWKISFTWHSTGGLRLVRCVSNIFPQNLKREAASIWVVVKIIVRFWVA